jgi:hypothetical protein
MSAKAWASNAWTLEATVGRVPRSPPGGLQAPACGITISIFSLLAFPDRICQMKSIGICDLLGSAETRDRIHSDLKTGEEQTNLKTTSKNTPLIKQSIEDTHYDQPSTLIPHDKDHADDP